MAKQKYLNEIYEAYNNDLTNSEAQNTSHQEA